MTHLVSSGSFIIWKHTRADGSVQYDSNPHHPFSVTNCQIHYRDKSALTLLLIIPPLCLSESDIPSYTSAAKLSFNRNMGYRQVLAIFKGQINSHLPVLREDLLITFILNTSKCTYITVGEIGTRFIWPGATLTPQTFHFISITAYVIQSLPLTQKTRSQR